MTSYEIPLTAGAQQFYIVLAGTQYSLTLYWCDPATCWVLDIDTAAGGSILKALPVVPGIDLLGQYPHLNFGGQLRVQVDGATEATPAYTDLGSAAHLYFIVP